MNKLNQMHQTYYVMVLLRFEANIADRSIHDEVSRLVLK